MKFPYKIEIRRTRQQGVNKALGCMIFMLFAPVLLFLSLISPLYRLIFKSKISKNIWSKNFSILNNRHILSFNKIEHSLNGSWQILKEKRNDFYTLHSEPRFSDLEGFIYTPLIVEDKHGYFLHRIIGEDENKSEIIWIAKNGGAIAWRRNLGIFYPAKVNTLSRKIEGKSLTEKIKIFIKNK